MKGLCPAPVADHKVEGGGVLGVDEGAVQADGAPAGVGHLRLIPEKRKFSCHALDIGQMLCHQESITSFKLEIRGEMTPEIKTFLAMF